MSIIEQRFLRSLGSEVIDMTIRREVIGLDFHDYAAAQKPLITTGAELEPPPHACSPGAASVVENNYDHPVFLRRPTSWSEVVYMLRGRNPYTAV